MVLAGGFGDALSSDGLLERHPAHESYWTRLEHFLTRTTVHLDSLTGKLGVDAGK